MADKIAELNADIKARLQASTDAIQAGLTPKPQGDAPAKPAAAKRTRSRKR